MRIGDWSSDVCSSDLHLADIAAEGEIGGRDIDGETQVTRPIARGPQRLACDMAGKLSDIVRTLGNGEQRACADSAQLGMDPARTSEAGRVGKECVGTMRTRGTPNHSKKKNRKE